MMISHLALSRNDATVLGEFAGLLAIYRQFLGYPWSPKNKPVMCTTSPCNDAKIHLVLNPRRSHKNQLCTKVGSLIMNLHWGTDEVWLLWSVKGHIRPMPIYFFPLPGVHTQERAT